MFCYVFSFLHNIGEEQFELWFEDLMGRLVREAKIGLVNWQLSAGGPEMATVAKACRKLHLDHLASLWGVPFETQQFAAWSRGKLVESTEREVIIVIWNYQAVAFFIFAPQFSGREVDARVVSRSSHSKSCSRQQMG